MSKKENLFRPFRNYIEFIAKTWLDVGKVVTIKTHEGDVLKTIITEISTDRSDGDENYLVLGFHPMYFSDLLESRLQYQSPENGRWMYFGVPCSQQEKDAKNIEDLSKKRYEKFRHELTYLSDFNHQYNIVNRYVTLADRKEYVVLHCIDEPSITGIGKAVEIFKDQDFEWLEIGTSEGTDAIRADHLFGV